ncbi:MAG: methyltransferase domain-containing protein [Endomicrobiales bacterium]|nr:methyltransferase domain-containing protein [Endomicrobiales bacterium]
MKSAFSLEIDNNSKYFHISEFDRNEIDNPDVYALSRIHYRYRIDKMVGFVTKVFHNPENTKVVDIGCAQGNLSLLLAEMGYSVYAVDLRETYLEYSKLKYEHGKIVWLNENVEKIGTVYPQGTFDVVILGELIEHCAFPENILADAMNLLREGGSLIVTTPNANKIFNDIQKFSKVKDRQSLVNKQYGPDGCDHLFLFEISDMKSIKPLNSTIIESGYIGSSLVNRFTMPLLKLLPIVAINWIMKIANLVWPVNRYLSYGLYWILRKNSSAKISVN